MTHTYKQNNSIIEMHYVPHKLNLFQRILQMDFLIPKSWRLRELKVKDGMIYISVMNGKEFFAPIYQCIVKYHDDIYDRMEVSMTYGNQKIHFKEIPWTLKKEEWEAIRLFIQEECNSEFSFFIRL